MYKNVYKNNEYKIDGQYKVRAGFLPKKDKLKESKEQKEVSIKEKVINLEEQLRKLQGEIAEKKNELENLTFEYEKLINESQKRAEEIINEAQKQAEDLKEQKKKVGYEEGFDKGYYDGLEKGKAEIENNFKNLIDTLKNIVENAKTEKQKLINSAEKDIVALSVDIAKRIVHQEISTKKEILVEIVKEAIKRIEDKEKIIIYANPDDIELIKFHRSEFQQIVDTDELHIMPDELLEQGECKIESKSEIIDTDLNHQFSEIKKKLLRKE